ALYQDIYPDQFLTMLGGQYTLDAWLFRAGYSYASSLLLNRPNGSLGGLDGVGTLPLNTVVPGVLAQNDLTKVVQTTLAPVI
ncbi:OmpP1/FadL family transporter, partial [Methylococcus sp. S2T]